jgi:hypothetical protein
MGLFSKVLAFLGESVVDLVVVNRKTKVLASARPVRWRYVPVVEPLEERCSLTGNHLGKRHS